MAWVFFNLRREGNSFECATRILSMQEKTCKNISEPPPPPHHFGWNPHYYRTLCARAYVCVCETERERERILERERKRESAQVSYTLKISCSSTFEVCLSETVFFLIQFFLFHRRRTFFQTFVLCGLWKIYFLTTSENLQNYYI